jgi:hypothetical protein
LERKKIKSEQDNSNRLLADMHPKFIRKLLKDTFRQDASKKLALRTHTTILCANFAVENLPDDANTLVVGMNKIYHPIEVSARKLGLDIIRKNGLMVLLKFENRTA